MSALETLQDRFADNYAKRLGFNDAKAAAAPGALPFDWAALLQAILAAVVGWLQNCLGQNSANAVAKVLAHPGLMQTVAVYQGIARCSDIPQDQKANVRAALLETLGNVSLAEAEGVVTEINSAVVPDWSLF